MSDTPVVPVLVDGQIVPMLDARGAWHGRSVTTHQGGPMTTRYIEETPCEHGRWNRHITKPDPAGSEWCPGGQRRELTGVETMLLRSSGRQPKQWCLKHDCEGLGNNDDLVGCTGAGVGVLADMDCRLVTVAIVALEDR